MNLPVIIGGLIAGAVREAVSRPDVPASPAAVQPIAKEVEKAVLPQVEHLTNSEPWYQSRVTWSAIVMVGTAVASLAFGATVTADDQAMWTSLGVAAMTLLSASLNLYARYFAKKPLGR